jgi:hypothetical protein
VKTRLEKYQIMARALLRLLERTDNPAVTLYCRQVILNGLIAGLRVERQPPPLALPSGKKQRLNEN